MKLEVTGIDKDGVSTITINSFEYEYIIKGVMAIFGSNPEVKTVLVTSKSGTSLSYTRIED